MSLARRSSPPAKLKEAVLKNNTVIVFCVDQSEVNQAVQEWVNVKGYKRVHTSRSSVDAAHMHSPSAGQYTRSTLTPIAKYKIVVVFEGD